MEDSIPCREKDGQSHGHIEGRDMLGSRPRAMGR